MIVCAGNIESFDFATPIGVGLIDSAITLSEICIKTPPKFLLFVGTAGSYGEKKIFDIIRSKSACNIENSYFTSNAYTPLDNLISTTPIVSRETIVNSSNYITTDISLATHYISRGIHLENMEFYAVMKVAQRFNIPTGGLFIVTNYCDSNAHRDFKANHAKAMQMLEEYLQQDKEKIFGTFSNG
ncbi:MAG: purine-nucleoside phosphorylase [Sulfurovaceae bacterium]|jgi:nucleoside phosphorylase|nr:purine-nucleoside phosphorylase [Sulfurovaceae bacterium]